MFLLYAIALTSAFFYTIGALYTKQAISGGAGLFRTTFIAQLATFLFVLPVCLSNLGEIHWQYWYCPILIAFIHFIGVISVMVAIRFGDISVQTPLMGTKVLFVCFFTWILIPGMIPLSWWIGSIFVFFGILILGLPDLLRKDLSWGSIALVLLGCATFAMTDVLVQDYSPRFGKNAFLLVMTATLCSISFLLIPFFKENLFKIPRNTIFPTVVGGSLLALQFVLLLFAYSYFGKASLINIIYSSRGVMSVFIIWIAGHWFQNHERRLGRTVMVRRIIATSIITGAIVFVMLDPSYAK